MFEQKILFNKIFSNSKIVGAIKDKVESHFGLFFDILKWRCRSIQRTFHPRLIPERPWSTGSCLICQ